MKGEGRLSDVKDKEPDRAPVLGSFHERLISCNGLGEGGFREWLFHLAMLFGSYDKWWGDPGKRDTLHEGLDICLYRTGDGDIHCLNERTKVPVLYKGEVVKVIGDFLGESVFVSHGVYNLNGSRLHTVYGHIKPHEHIRPGSSISAGDIIGTLADTGKSSGVIPHHLHISVAWISDTVRPEELGWQIMGNDARIMLLDPLHVIECPYSIIFEV